MTSKQLIREIQRLAKEEGSQKGLAEKLGVSCAYLSDVLHERREPGKKILSRLGLKREVRYT